MRKQLTAIRSFVCLLMFSIVTLISIRSNAQSPPACAQNCSAKDIKVKSIELVMINPNYDPSDASSQQYIPLPPTCNQGDQITGYLKVNLDVTAATRYTFVIAGELYVDNVHISASDPFQCFPNTLNQGLQSLIITSDPIQWQCGNKLEIRNVFTAWGNSSSDNVCTQTCDQISSHCKRYGINETFTVVTSLAASYTWSASCTNGNVYQTISFDASGTSGGTTPYSYQWDFDNDGTFDETTSSATTSHTYTSAGTFTVKLRVTDNNGNTNDYFDDVDVVACCTSPTINTQPQDATACAGQGTSFTASASGDPTIKWQYRVNSGASWTDVPNSSPYSNVNTGTLNISDVTGLDGYQYRAVFTSGACTPANTDPATLTVNTAPTITTDPVSVTKCTGSSASFTVSYNGGSPAPTFQWQIKNGVSWDNLSNTSPYSGVTTQTLNISDVTGLDGQQYRVVLTSGTCGAVNSAAATLSVDPASVGGTAAATTSPICSGSSTTISLSGNVGSIVKWQYSTGGGWSDINSTDNPLNTGTLTVTTTFRAVVQSGVCSSANSSEVTVSVDPPSVGGTAGSAQTICSGSQPNSDLAVTGITGSVVKWQYSTDAAFTTPVDIASSNSSTLSKTTIGTLTADRWFRAVVQSGVCSVDYSNTVKITVNQLPSIPNVTINVQYSDPIPASDGSFTVTDDGAGSSLSIVSPTPRWKKAGDPTYTSGLPTGITLTAGTTGTHSQDWVVGAGTGVTLAPGTYYIQITVNDGLCSSTKDLTLVVAPENACGSFTSNVLFMNTNTQGNIGNATIPLSIVVSQEGDGSLGDLTKATATFTVNGDNGTSYSFTKTLSNPTLNGDGTVTFSTTFNPFVDGNPKLNNLSSSNPSATLIVDWSFGGYFTEASTCDDEAIITISYPADDFTTGGGYIWNTNSTRILGRNGSGDSKKNNFGFNVKWNKNQTNLQGVFTTIIRKDGKLYQVKSNKPTYITTEKLNGTYTKGGKTFYKYKSTIIYSNAVIKELKGSNCTLVPNCSVGNGTVNLIVYDNGEPGSTSGATNDQIGFTVRDGANTLYYATDVYSTTGANKYFTTTQTDLAGGNIQVHVGAGSGSAALTTAREIQNPATTLNQAFELRGTPNPTFSYFTIQLPNQNAARVNLRVTDVLGRVVEVRPNLAPGGSLRIGNNYKPGVYIVEAIQGDVVKQIKLVKQ